MERSALWPTAYLVSFANAPKSSASLNLLKLPTLPKGLPAPPAQPTTFIVYVAAKQWRTVEAALADPRDVLIVEGVPMYDERLPGVALMAQSVTTKTLQATKRQSNNPVNG